MGLGRLDPLGSWEGKWLGSGLDWTTYPEIPSLNLDFSLSRVRALSKLALPSRHSHSLPGYPCPASLTCLQQL